MTVTANKYHWISSQALELKSKPYLTKALAAEMKAAPRTQRVPKWLNFSLAASIDFDSANNEFMFQLQ
jgi:hypothetical protein